MSVDDMVARIKKEVWIALNRGDLELGELHDLTKIVKCLIEIEVGRGVEDEELRAFIDGLYKKYKKHDK